MKVDAALLRDPVRLAEAIIELSQQFTQFASVLGPIRETARNIEWWMVWYRDPGSAWWER